MIRKLLKWGLLFIVGLLVLRFLLIAYLMLVMPARMPTHRFDISIDSPSQSAMVSLHDHLAELDGYECYKKDEFFQCYLGRSRLTAKTDGDSIILSAPKRFRWLNVKRRALKEQQADVEAFLINLQLSYSVIER